MKWIKRLAIAMVTFIVIAGLVLHFVLPYMVIKPMNRHHDFTPERYGVAFESINIKGEGDINLSAFYIPSTLDTAYSSIIYFHGIGDCKESWISTAVGLAKQGYNGLVFDGRAHGKSEGEYITYGHYEKKDAARIIDWLEAKNEGLKVGVYGESLGGAIALLCLEYDERLDFGVVQSTFADLTTINQDYSARIIGFRWDGLSDYNLANAGEIANFDPALIQPAQSAKQIEQPMFMSHGDADANIDFKYGQAIYNNLASEHKQFYRLEGLNHFNIGAEAGPAYHQAILDFVGKYGR